MNRFFKLLIVFGIGGFLYGGIEIVFRGYTHWSMFLAGGFIFSVLYKLYGYIGRGHLILKCTLGCVIITTVEFLTGVGVNILLNMNVWDYSDKALNVFGQICLAFSIGWFFISIPASLLAEGIRRQLKQA
ncbi:MAG: hypothetical protein IJZ57_03805 [Clostridia bacterium]|nr:hypothetical protein [Clostridia bacterium]